MQAMSDNSDAEQAMQCADRLEEVLKSYGGFIAVEGLVVLLNGRAGIARYIAEEVRYRDAED